MMPQCCLVKSDFSSWYSAHKLDHFPNWLSIDNAWEHITFNGDEIIGDQTKSPDCICFVRKTNDSVSKCKLRVVERHEPNANVFKEKKDGFESFFKTKYNITKISEKCQDYLFIAVLTSGSRACAIKLSQVGIKTHTKNWKLPDNQHF